MQRSRVAWWAAALLLGGPTAAPLPASAGPVPCLDTPFEAGLSGAGHALRQAEEFDFRPGDDIYLQAALFPTPAGMVTAAPAGEGAASEAGPTVVDVRYDGFSPEAQAAFQRAVDVWRGHISSPIPITIEARFDPLDAGILGGARPAMFVREREGATPWYPVALAEALLGRPLLPGTPDIVATFNDDPNLWYFAGDGRPPPDKYDFTTVALHELGHGLGMTGDFASDGGVGSWGGGLSDGVPTVFDSLVADSDGRLLIETSANGSSELGSRLVNGPLSFAGPASREATGGPGPALFVPATWADGTSLYHLDPGLAPPGTPDALMNPSLGRGIAIPDAGPVVDAVFRDLGWLAPVPGPPLDVAVVTGGRGVTVTWRPPAAIGSSAISGYVLTFTPAGGRPVEWSVPDSPAVVSGLDEAVYDVRVAAVNGSGRGAFSPGTAVAALAPTAITTTATAPPLPARAAPAGVVPPEPPRSPAAPHPPGAGTPPGSGPRTADVPCLTPAPGPPDPELSAGLASSPGTEAATRAGRSGAEDHLRWLAGAGAGLLAAGAAIRRWTRPRAQ